MSDNTKIEWTDATWNPIVGCCQVSTGCKNCYAEKMAARLAAMGTHPQYSAVIGQDGKWNGKVRLVVWALVQPLRWRKPRRVFVCSMGDLFHENILSDWIHRVFTTMVTAERHTFLLLTKRAWRMRASVTWALSPPPNIWLGVSAETQEWADKRIPDLLSTPAAVRFVSLEPLLEPIDLCRQFGQGVGELLIDGLDWVIVGCESLPGGRVGRPCKLEWVRDVVRQCREEHVPVFVKQLNLDGKLVKDIKKFPEDLQIREYPEC